MAWSEIETRIANPARKKPMAKKLSAKQIRYFGTPRQKAALKAKRKATKHRARTAPVKHKRKNSAPRHHHAKKRTATKRKNPEIISFLLGNPARKKGHTMASHKKKKRAASKSAGSPRRHGKRKVMNKAHRKRNAGYSGALPKPVEWAKLGVGGIGGGFLTRILPQFAGSSNTGPMGYALNALAAVGITIGVHMVTKDKFLTMGAATGGALALSGFGDYMVSNFVTPQRIVNPQSAIWEVPSGWGTQPAALPYGGAGSGSDKGTDGNSF